MSQSLSATGVPEIETSPVVGVGVGHRAQTGSDGERASAR